MLRKEEEDEEEKKEEEEEEKKKKQESREREKTEGQEATIQQQHISDKKKPYLWAFAGAQTLCCCRGPVERETVRVGHGYAAHRPCKRARTLHARSNYCLWGEGEEEEESKNYVNKILEKKKKQYKHVANTSRLVCWARLARRRQGKDVFFPKHAPSPA